MRILITFFLLIFLTMAVAAQQSLKEGNAAPQFSAPALNGQIYDLNQLHGKVVVITFWSTKCEICHSEIPKMNQLVDRYKGREIVFLGLTMENEDKVSNYLRSTRFDFTILPNSFGTVLQYADRDKAGNINMGFPAYFLVDQTGEIQLKTSGWDKTPALDSKISNLLGTSGGNKAVAETMSLPK
jgi:peroxiredoxin